MAAPIIIYRAHGVHGDELDHLKVGLGFEDPQRWEDTLIQAHHDARSDHVLSKVLEQSYLQEDRENAFASFAATGAPEALANLMSRFGLNRDCRVVDLGCGPGHLAFALDQLGFSQVAAMDPNQLHRSGTGYLRSVAGDRIEIINDLTAWRETKEKFDAIVSMGTVHHWGHIPLVALDARRAIKPGGFWFAVNEFYANTPRELSALLQNHPTASRYNSYEWAYPASAYVDLIQSVGWTLVGVIPYFYRKNELLGNVMRPAPPELDVEELNRTVDKGLGQLNGVVDAFWSEVDLFRRQDHGHRVYTEPQALIFQRVAV